MKLNGKQIIAITAAVLSVLMVSTSQLTDLFGPSVAKTIISVAGLVNTILTSVIAALTTQSQQIKDVSGMTGVEVQVSRSADKSVAALAVDPTNENISAAPGEAIAVAKKAEAPTP